MLGTVRELGAPIVVTPQTISRSAQAQEMIRNVIGRYENRMSMTVNVCHYVEFNIQMMR